MWNRTTNFRTDCRNPVAVVTKLMSLCENSRSRVTRIMAQEIKLSPLEDDAFDFELDSVTSCSTHDNKKSGIKSLSCAVIKLDKAINSPFLNDKQRVKALHKVSTHPGSRKYFKSSKLIDQKKYTTLEVMGNQMKKAIKKATKTNHWRGKANDDQRSFV